MLLGFGFALVVQGACGRAVDDHPVCRRCRFDLVGLPATSSRCSECGSDLSLPRAVLAGNRRRRPGLILAGVLLVLPSLAGLALVIVATTSNIAWIQYAPHWYILREARSTTAAVHDPALAELSRRLAASSLSDSQIASVLDAGLALQADRAATWVPAWGDLIESARAVGKVSDEKWKQYLVNAPAVSLSVRPEIRRGERLVVRINELPARCGMRSSLWAQNYTQLQPDSDLADPRYEGGSMGSSLSPSGNGSFGHDYVLSPDAVAAVADGPKTIHLKVVMDLYAHNPSGTTARPKDGTTTFDLRGTWSLVPADAPTVRAVDDPAARPAVEAGIRVDEVRFNDNSDYAEVQVKLTNLPVPIAYRVILRAGGREWPAGGIYAVANYNAGWGTICEAKGLTADRVDVVLRPDPAVEAGIQVQELALRYSLTYPQIMIKVGKLPVPIAYRVILRAGDREWQAGQIYAPANNATTWGTGGEAKGLTADRVDVVLRPDPTVATETVDMHDYWNGEVVIKDVPVQRVAK